MIKGQFHVSYRKSDHSICIFLLSKLKFYLCSIASSCMRANCSSLLSRLNCTCVWVCVCAEQQGSGAKAVMGKMKSVFEVLVYSSKLIWKERAKEWERRTHVCWFGGFQLFQPFTSSLDSKQRTVFQERTLLGHMVFMACAQTCDRKSSTVIWVNQCEGEIYSN